MMPSVRFPALLLAVGFLASPAAMAQTAPTSGELLQQVPALPEPATPAPQLTIEQAGAPVATDTTPFPVQRIVIEGATAFDTATLHALVSEGEGTSLTLAQLNGLAQRITDYYRTGGYPLARAIVPAQALDAGTVRIQVIEARYDQVLLDNRGRIGDGLLQATLAPLVPGTPVTGAGLDRALLLLAELPGAQPRATLKPGTEVGTSTIVVQVDPGPAFSGQVSLDNAGNRYTGRVRLGTWLQVNNPLHHGDQLSIGALTGGEDLVYARLGYQTTLNGQGTQLGAAYSVLDYTLGGDLDALQAHGTAKVASAWLSQPLLRSRTTTLDARLQIDRKRLRDDIDSVAQQGQRHTTSWTLGLDGQRSDANGVTRASVDLVRGELEFDDAAAALADAGTARTAGAYTRWTASLERLQTLTTHTRLLLALSGQGSGDNLDSSEQFLLGGPDSVRGYAVGALAGASGHLLTLELRHDLAWFETGRTEGVVFFDTGALRFNADPWTTDDNHVRVQSAGAGLNWSGPNQWSASLQVAAPVGGTPDAAGEDDKVRAWVRVTKGF